MERWMYSMSIKYNIELESTILFILMLAVAFQRLPIPGANHLYVISIVLFLYWCYKNKVNAFKCVKERVGKVLIIYYISFCLCFIPSILCSDMIGHSLQEFLKYFFVALLPFVMTVVLVKNKKFVEKLFLGIILIACVDASIALYQALVMHIEAAPGISGHYLKLAGYLACMIPMVVAVTMDRSFSKYFRCFCGIAAIILLACGFIASRSRALWCILLIVVPLVFLCHGRKLFKYKTICIVGMLGICLVGGFFLTSEKNLTRLKSSTNVTTNGSNLDRLRMWHAVSLMVKDYPLTGVGIGNYKRAFQCNYMTPNMHLYDHPHSSYMLLGAEGGVPGFIAIVGAVLAVLFTCFKKWFNTKNVYYFMLFVGWLGFSIFSIIEPIVMYEIIMMPMMFLSGCYLVCIYLDNQREEQTHV